MKIRQLHGWDLSIAEARDLQTSLASQVLRESRVPATVEYIAAADISGALRGEEALGAVVVCAWPSLELAEVRTIRKRPPMPYMPGLLSFRETPVLVEAFEQLTLTPDLVLVDGHGVAHPRRFGIACHLGLLLQIPTIGCAKSLLVGQFGNLDRKRGAWTELTDHGEVIGAAVRTKKDVTPIFASIGWGVDLPLAIHWVLATARRVRLPEPARLAHAAASGRLFVGLRPGKSEQMN